MKNIIANDLLVIGVDPGIRNTAITAIHFESDKKTVLCFSMLKSVAKSHKKYAPDSVVLEKIGRKLDDIINKYSGWNMVVAVESVFHTKFLTSAVQTGKVIGVCHYISGTYCLPCLEISPPTVKKALGLSTKDKKEQIVKRAEALLGVKMETHHLADSCGIAIAAYLKIKAAAVGGNTVDVMELI